MPLFLILTLFISSFSIAQSTQSNSSIGVVASSQVFSQRFNLTEDKAYKFQHSFVKNALSKGSLTHGYKAGLVAKAAQQKYGVESLVTGVLLKEPMLGENNPVITLKGRKTIYMEVEFAYQLNTSITEPIDDIEQLKTFITRAAPAIELPNANFTTEDFNGFDIIANNALADGYIIGQWTEDLSSIGRQDIALTCADKTIVSVIGKDIPQQWQVLQDMINHLVERGFSLRAGHILLSGNLGKLVPASPCAYKADFGNYGTIEYTVKP